MGVRDTFFEYVDQLSEKAFLLHWFTKVRNYPEYQGDEFTSSKPYTLGTFVQQSITKGNVCKLYIVTECTSIGNWFEEEYRVRVVPFKDHIVGTPILPLRKPIEMKPGDVASYPKTQKTILSTTPAYVYMNQRILVETVGDKIPYINDPITPKLLNSIIETNLNTGKIDASEAYAIITNTIELGQFTDLGLKSFGTKTFTTDPKIEETKQKLLSQLSPKDRKNPTKIIELEEKLEAMDRAYLKGSDEEHYHDAVGGKSYNQHRKKLHYMFGGVTPFNPDESGHVLIDRPLKAGWDVDNFDVYVNESYKGSYFRGKETAKGGEKNKYVQRIYGDLVITKYDCGTTRGTVIELPVRWNQMVAGLIGRYEAKTNKELTKEYLTSKLGTAIMIRDPNVCEQTDGLCFHCLTSILKVNDITELMGPLLSLTSAFLSNSLAAFHGGSLKKNSYVFSDHFVV